MNLRLFTPLLFVAAASFAAEPPKLPSIPAEPIARKKELLFSDDFERACELTAAIRARAVELRRAEGLKLPDAIICATALEHGVELWTNDARLGRVGGLVCRSVALV